MGRLIIILLNIILFVDISVSLVYHKGSLEAQCEERCVNCLSESYCHGFIPDVDIPFWNPRDTDFRKAKSPYHCKRCFEIDGIVCKSCYW